MPNSTSIAREYQLGNQLEFYHQGQLQFDLCKISQCAPFLIWHKSEVKDLENLQTSLKEERDANKLLNQSLSDVNNKLLKTEATNSSLDEKYSLVKDELTRLQIKESEMNTSLAESKVALMQVSKDIESIRSEKNLLGIELDKAKKTIGNQKQQIKDLNNIQERLDKLVQKD